MDRTATVDPADVARLVSTDYDLGAPDECRLMQSGVNDTYAVEVAGSQYALRLYGRDKWYITGEGDHRFELGLLTHLHTEGVPVSAPVPRRNGDPLGRVTTPRGHRYYALFSWAPGKPGDDTEERVRLVGQTLAAIHVAADRYHPEYHRYALDERNLLERPVEGYEPTLRVRDPAGVAFVKDQVADLQRRIRAFEPGPGGWGIIHADPQILNIHFTTDDRITIFDFDLCAYGWRAYDVAYYYTRIPERLRAAALQGYESVRPLSDAEHDMLPALGRLAWIWEGLRSGQLVKRLNDPYISFSGQLP